jgi:hypothetical protein
MKLPTTIIDVDFFALPPARRTRRIVRLTRAALVISVLLLLAAAVPGGSALPIAGTLIEAGGMTLMSLLLHVPAAIASGLPAWRLDAVWRRV